MLDYHPPNWTITDESFPVMAFERAKNPLKGRWTCPGDETIAAYVDGALDEDRRTRLESHLSQCEACRSVVSDVLKLQRDIDELPVPPLTATKKALAAPARIRARSDFIWRPAVAMAIVFFVAAIAIWRREPQKVLLTPSPGTSSPTIAKVEEVTPENSDVHEITRQPLIHSIAPVILSPLRDSTVERDQLRFTWKALDRSRYYEVSVVGSDGDLLWAKKTQDCSIRLPRTVAMKHGPYFVWITAYLIDGQAAKSSPVKFVVDR